MTLEIIKTTQMGWEIWVVMVGGEARFQHMSENAARSQMMKLQQTIGA